MIKRYLLMTLKTVTILKTDQRKVIMLAKISKMLVDGQLRLLTIRR